MQSFSSVRLHIPSSALWVFIVFSIADTDMCKNPLISMAGVLTNVYSNILIRLYFKTNFLH